MANKNKKSTIKWKDIIIQAIVDLIVGITLLLMLSKVI